VATGTAQLAGTLTSADERPEGDARTSCAGGYSGAAGLVDDGLVLRAPASVVISYGILADATTASLGYVDFADRRRGQPRSAIASTVQLTAAARLADTIITLVGQSQLDATATCSARCRVLPSSSPTRSAARSSSRAPAGLRLAQPQRARQQARLLLGASRHRCLHAGRPQLPAAAQRPATQGCSTPAMAVELRHRRGPQA
jgi:hypothetical protein